MGLFEIFFGGVGRRRGGRSEEYRNALREMRKQKSKLYRSVRTIIILLSALSVTLLVLSTFTKDLRTAWLYKGVFIIFAICAGGGMLLPWLTEFERYRSKVAKGEQVAVWHKYVVFVAWGLIGVCTLLWIISVLVIGDGLEKLLELIAGNGDKDFDFSKIFFMLRLSLIVTLQVAIGSIIATSTMRFGKNYLLLRSIMYVTFVYLDFWLSWFIGGVTLEGIANNNFAPISNTFLWVMAVLMVVALFVASGIFGAQARRKELALFMKGDVDTLTSGDVDLIDAETKSEQKETVSAEPKTAEKDPEQQLNKIKELLDKGIISEEEYQQKRRDIIDKM